MDDGIKVAGGTPEQKAAAASQIAERQAEAAQAAQAERVRETQRAEFEAAAARAIEAAETKRRGEEAEAASVAEAEAKAKADPGAEARRMLDEAAELRAQAESERDRLQSLGNDYDARLKRERDRDRVETLRRMGAIGGVSDAHLLMIAPDVDPETVQGKAALDEWRELNAGLFAGVVAPTIPSAEAMISGMPRRQSAWGTYDREYFAKIWRDNFGSE